MKKVSEIQKILQLKEGKNFDRLRDGACPESGHFYTYIMFLAKPQSSPLLSVEYGWFNGTPDKRQAALI